MEKFYKSSEGIMVTLNESIQRVVRDELSDIHTSLPARIEKYNFETQKAEVKPLIKKRFRDDSELSQPQVVEVPVVWPRGQESSLTMPLQRGNYGLLIFSERGLENFLYSGRDLAPSDFRKFDLTDGIFIPGLYPFTEPSLAENNEDVLLRHRDGKIRMKPNDDLEIECNAKSVDAGNEITITASKDITINTDTNVTINAQTVTINADVTINGNVNASGEVTIGGSGAVPIARQGDQVEVEVTSGSSAGTYTGEITEGSNNSSTV